MSNYKTITALLGGRIDPRVQESLLKPLQSLEETTLAVSKINPTDSNQLARESFVEIAEQLTACLAPANPLNLFKGS